MREEYMSSQEIMQEIADLKIRLVLQQEFEREAAEAVEKSNDVGTEEIQLMRAMEQDVLHDMEQHMSRPVRSQHWSSRKWIRILAVALILMAVSMGTALATVHMVKIGLIQLDVKAYQERTSFGLIKVEDALDVPVAWAGKFYPAYIPDGFALKDCALQEAEYQNAKGESLSFCEYDYGTKGSLDTENATVSNMQVNGAEAILIEKNGWSAIVWSANNQLFVVEMDGSSEETVKIAESISLIP